MRLRNVKNKGIIFNNSTNLVTEPQNYIGKWHKVFGNDHPIYLEIGMGKGKFLIENALRYPNINFVGIDRFDSVLAKALKKMPPNCNNLKVIQLNGDQIDGVFNHEIERIYLNFSDPWPKERHKKRRLVNEAFLEKYSNIFKHNQVIHMKTDNMQLFEYALESFSQYGYILKEVHLDLHNSASKDIITTEYEEKFMKDNMPIYQCIVEKSIDLT